VHTEISLSFASGVMGARLSEKVRVITGIDVVVAGGMKVW
jgi:hypothetical protein